MSGHCLFSAKCCRICSAECENIQDIFKTTENGKRAVDMLEFCLQHPIDTSDSFPKSICIECMRNLIQTYQFFVLFKKSEEYFVSLYQKLNEMTISTVTNNIKIESFELHEMNEVLIKSEPSVIDCFIAADLLEDRPNITNDNNENKNENPLSVCSDFYDERCAGEPKEIDKSHKWFRIQKQFECFDCKDKSFVEFKDLAFHVRTHLNHMENIEMNNVETIFDNVVIDDGIKYHVCEVCGNSYTNNKKLYQHRFNVHPSRTNPKNKTITIVQTTGNEPVQRNISDRECYMCNLKYSTKSMLDEHLQTHSAGDEEKYMARKNVCTVSGCGKRYTKNSSLIKHMRNHTGERPFECICGGRFIDRACLKKHMRICPSHTLIPIEKKPLKSFEERCEFDCKLCNYRFTSKERAELHSKTHTKEDERRYNQRKYQCDIKGCAKRFHEGLSLERHKLTHTGEQPHQCESCYARYSDYSSLTKHLKNCAPHLIKRKPEGPFKCPHCSCGLYTVRGWLTHKGSHTALIHDCEYENCTESFRSTAEIVSHVKIVHAHELQSFQCNYDDKCARNYPLKYLLDAHMDRHKRHRAEHLCTECGIVTSTSSGLSHHMKYKHSDEKNEICTQCGSRFKDKYQLQKHLITHSAIKKFKCDCGKIFSHKNTLTKHKRTHSGVKNFVCDEIKCGKAFFNKAVLIQHMRTHTGEKPYKCEQLDCNRSFAQKGDLNKHLLIHLGPTPHKCECGQSFRLITELRKHSLLHYKPPPME